MTLSSSLRVLLASASVAVVALTASGAAQAQNSNVYWSVGMSAPGMQVGVASAPPMAMYPPVYYTPPVWQPRFGYGHNVGYGYGHRMEERFEHGRGGWGGGHEGGHRY